MPDAQARRTSLDRLKLYLSMVRYGNAHNQDFAREQYSFFADMRAYLQKHMGDLRGQRVLDVGCGKSLWLTLLLHSCGAQVSGIDSEAVAPGFSPGKYAALLRHNGPERTLRTLAWELLYARPYYRELGALAPFKLNWRGLDVRAMSVTELDFAPSSFDLIVSHDVLEHLPDVPAALCSLWRALKPEGLTYISVHNYTSLSGGHHIAWKYPDTEPSSQVPAWDHLRHNLYPQIPSWINRLRMRDYRQAFEAQFDILDWFPTAFEGRALLTPEIQAELSDYGQEELLIKAYVVVARPKKINTTQECYETGFTKL